MPRGQSSPRAQFYGAARIARDIVFTCLQLDFTSQVIRFNSNVRFYHLNATELEPIWTKIGEPFLGATHLSDIPYVFNEAVPNADIGPLQYYLGARSSGSFISFVNHGDPARGILGTRFTEWSVADNGSRLTSSKLSSTTILNIGPPAETALSFTRLIQVDQHLLRPVIIMDWIVSWIGLDKSHFRLDWIYENQTRYPYLH